MRSKAEKKILSNENWISISASEALLSFSVYCCWTYQSSFVGKIALISCMLSIELTGKYSQKGFELALI